ncbi:hypothetical protein TWF696_005122 [Orbilia brochopaga]|uniref:Uncharacterized protein n=1 Tax=Orbilia brochopaga TaxID=3140254 RepID=A0AAV9V2I8_9PEZI
MQPVFVFALVLGYYAFWVPALLHGHTLFHFIAAYITYACELLPLVLPVPLIHLWITDRPRFAALQGEAATWLHRAVDWLVRFVAEWHESTGCLPADGSSLTSSVYCATATAAPSGASSADASAVSSPATPTADDDTATRPPSRPERSPTPRLDTASLDALSSHYEDTPSPLEARRVPGTTATQSPAARESSSSVPAPAPTSTASAHPADCECTPCGEQALLHDSVPDASPSPRGIHDRYPADLAVGGAVRGDDGELVEVQPVPQPGFESLGGKYTRSPTPACGIGPFPPPKQVQPRATTPLLAPRPQRWIGYPAFEARVERQLAAQQTARRATVCHV